MIGYLGDNYPQASPCIDPPGSSGYTCDDIRFVTLRTDGTGMKNTALTLEGEPVKSIDAPGLTCRADWGSVPCVMSWVSISGSACVHWGRFDVLASGAVSLYEDYATGCIYGYQTPQLANVDLDASKPFRMTLRQEGSLGNGNRVYTFKHTPVINQAWTNQASFAISPWVLSPTYGAFDYVFIQNYVTEQDVFYVVTYN